MIANAIILGCGRSGTSIFGELFEALGAHRYLFEPSIDTVRLIDFRAGPVAMKVPKAQHGAPMTAGLPFRLEELLELVPEPRVVFWQVRHPFDAVCSLRPGIEANWSHNPKPPDWQEWLLRPLVERCARHWSYINLLGYRAVRAIALLNRYEDLVADPHGTATSCCEAAGIAPALYGEAIGRWASSVSNRKSPVSYEAKHQVVWSRQDHTVRVERWKENLSAVERAAVREIVGEAALETGYSLEE